MNKFSIPLADVITLAPGRIVEPYSWVEHVPFAFWVTKALAPRLLVELGVHSGNSYNAFCQAVKAYATNTSCYGIDTWQGDEHTGSYDESIFTELWKYQKEHFPFSQLLRMTFDEGAAYFSEGSIDLLHIDGLHYYESVKHDFETWLPKMSDRGVILFHDTNVRERGFGVWKLWEELQTRYPAFEFKHGHGLGVVSVGNVVPAPLECLFGSANQDGQYLSGLFPVLGSRISLLQTVRRQGEQLGNQTLQLTHRERQSAERDQQLADRDRKIACLNQQLIDRERQSEEWQRQVAEQDRQLIERERQASGLTSALAERDKKLTALERQLAEVINSKSWRIAAPLRQLNRWTADARNFIRAISRFAKRSGGIASGAKKVRSIYRYEGWAGIRSRIAKGPRRSALFTETSPQVHFDASIAYHPKQGYFFADGSTEYTFIPPQRPFDVDRLIENMAQKYVFSILTPIYNTPPDLLKKMLDSVISQWYPHWQLILVDDASTSESTKEALKKITDRRIVLSSLPYNRGIAGATNAALALSTGEFVVLLDHDDELTEDCLFELAQCINQDNPDFIYSDEDKIAEDGRFVEPHFKPDWSPDTMMSTMYTCHVCCIRRDLIEKVGGLRSDYNGCQDWDLVLRVTESTNRICHISKVLYHWRIIPASIAANIAAKPYVLDASRRVREDALARRGVKGVVEEVDEVKGYFRINYHLTGDPLISIIIPTRDKGEVLHRCLASLFEKSTCKNLEILVLDNGSVQPSTLSYLQDIRKQERIRVIRHDKAFNFSELNNIGASHASGSVLLFLNDDTEVMTVDWLERMAGYAQQAHVGAVGAKLLYPGGKKIQHAGLLNLEDGPGHAFLRQDADIQGYYLRNLIEYDWLAVTGACLMVERSKFRSIGGFDEAFPIAYNDVELCLRLRSAGLYNVVCQSVRLVHHESVSRGQDHLDARQRERLARDKRKLFDKHPAYFQHDPFHSPNLHPNSVHFDLAR